MNRPSLLCVLVAASAVLSACDIPDATFGATASDSTAGTTGTESAGGSGASSTTTSSGGGHTVTHSTTGGGDGGGGSGGGTTTSSSTTSSSTTTTTTTSSTTATGAVVQCGFPSVKDCDPGEVCCFDKTADPVDFCGPPGSCTPPADYAELKCENDDDCPGKVCCAYYVLDANFQPEWQSMYCDTSCADDQELETCKTQADCDSGVCDEMFGSAYPNYKACWTL